MSSLSPSLSLSLSRSSLLTIVDRGSWDIFSGGKLFEQVISNCTAETDSRNETYGGKGRWSCVSRPRCERLAWELGVRLPAASFRTGWLLTSTSSAFSRLLGNSRRPLFFDTITNGVGLGGRFSSLCVPFPRRLSEYLIPPATYVSPGI